MSKKLLVYLLIIIYPIAISAQSEKIDSLRNALNDDLKDSNYINTLNKLIGEIRYHDAEKALELCVEGIAISEKIGFQRGLMLMNYNKGVSAYSIGEFTDAIQPIENALDIATIQNNMNVVSACYNVLGVLYQNLNQPENSLKYLFKSLELGEELKDSFAILDAYINIGTQYYDKTNMNLANSFWLKAEKLGLILKDTITLGSIYLNLSNIEKNETKKLNLLTKASIYAEAMNDPYNLSFINQSYGSIYLDKGNNELANQYFIKSYRQAEQINNQYLMVVRGTNIAVSMMKLNQYDSAKYYLDNSMKLAKENEYEDELRNNYFYLSQWFKDNKDYKNAIRYLELENELRDTLFNGTIAEKLSEANAKYQNAEKEKEIASQQLVIERQKNEKNVIYLSSILVLLIASSLFIWYYSNSRRKKREAELALKFEHDETLRLREIDEMKTQFFTNISHELRTPLTLIIGPLEKALQSPENSEDIDILLAHKNSEKLLGLVNEIMDLSKLESGKLILYPRIIELLPLIRRIYYSFESFAKIQNINLRFDYNIDDGACMEIDVEKFEKILNNLVSNAIKFSSKNQSILMQVSDDDDMFFVSVKDEGVGINSDEIEKVFDRFYQSSNDGQTLQGGTGVGLALSKQLALLFGGDLTVSSQLNEGSTFTLSLPKKGWIITDVQEVENQEIEENKINENQYIPLLINGERPNILIVEDNLDMSQYLNRLLSTEYNCTLANDGMEALKLIQTRHFDLISSDVMMPHMDGFKFREKVNEFSNFKRIPFIFLTARALEEDKLFGLRLGVDDFITKPFNADELMARIYNLLSNKIEREKWLQEQGSTEIEYSNADNSETRLLKEAERIVYKNIANPNFKVNDLAGHLNLGERQLRRVIKKLTGLSPVNFILEIRLQKAFQLLERREYLTISEVRYDIGIESASYFTSKFKARFGRNPKEVLG